MRQLQLVVVGGIVLVALGCGAKRANVVVTPAMQELAGSWTFNPADSDDSATVFERLREGLGRGGPGGPPGGGGGFSGRGGMGGGRGAGRRPGGEGGPPRGEGPRNMGNVLRAPQLLTIAVGDSTVSFDQHDGVTRVLYTDGRKVTQQLGPNAKMTLKSHWQGQHFLVEREMDRGMKVTEEYLVEPTEHRLHVIVEVNKVTFVRIYDHS